ncbi:RsbR, positive regulator of sigma-B [Labilithrix luteola]|uniref:RsbR, positive regulator of sigma-B n=1 Tax=Labilithrix luteola TaxID=1391654 RepID=A0A0K1Q0J7_9BACT|nr:STAS domain-containing protein [Labilithrix luteola]AKU99300.1 RsbR, positive regulator of sigma-B [Labilithrix luteola]
MDQVKTEQSDWLTKVLAHLPGAIYACRLLPNGITEWPYASAGICALLDTTPGEFAKDPTASFMRIVPEDLTTVETTMKDAIANGTTFTWNARLNLSNGSLRWLRFMSTAHVQADGSILWFGQVFDATSERETEQRLIAAEHARERTETMLKKVVDHLPVGVSVMSTSREPVLWNNAFHDHVGQVESDKDFGYKDLSTVYRPDGVTPYPLDELPVMRALRGEQVDSSDMCLGSATGEINRRLAVSATPLRDGQDKLWAALLVTRDVTEERRMDEELRHRAMQLADSEKEKTELIERLRYAVDELSNPILEVWNDVLAMPLIGVVDSRRTAEMTERLLAEVSRTQAQFVIIDLTGVEVVDTKTADNLVKLVRSVELIGARCMLTGIKPAVAQTLVNIGVDFSRLTTLRNLRHGLREALRRDKKQLDAGGTEAAAQAAT